MGKKSVRLLSLVLAAALACTFPAAPAKADSSGLCFVATNDWIRDIELMPYYYGGLTYVRCDLFKDLGISYNYLPSGNAVVLNSGSTQLIFDLNEGTCYDGDRRTYPMSATTLSGAIYVPVQVADYFGLTRKVLSGNGNGDVLRITNGAQSLSNELLMDAGAGRILDLNLQYNGGAQTTSPPAQSEPPEVSGAPVHLSFIGLPTAELLDTMKSFSVNATFFITAEEAESDPDMVRRIVGSGNVVGVYCQTDPEAECGPAAKAIWEAAFFTPTIMTSSELNSAGHREYAAENGFFYYSSNLVPADTRDASAVTLALPRTGQSSDFCFYSGEDTEAILQSVLYYIATNGYIATALLETMC